MVLLNWQQPAMVRPLMPIKAQINDTHLAVFVYLIVGVE